MYDIITTGSATLDVFVSTKSQLVKFVTDTGEKDYIAYPSGSKILIDHLHCLIGGGGTNTAVSFSRLGFKTAYLGKLGADSNAKLILDLLKKEHIEFIGAQEGQSGYSVILDSIEDDRTILTFKGSNNFLHAKDVLIKSFKSKWFYSSSLTGESLKTLRELMDLAVKTKTKIAFNPSNYQAKKGYDALKDILKKCTVLVINKEEAELLFDKKTSPLLFKKFILSYPKKYVLITDGPQGATCYHDNKIIHILPNSHLRVVETTGAGDAFASTFVAGIMKKLSLIDSLKIAMIQSESVIAHVGSKEKLLSEEEIMKKLPRFQGAITFQRKFLEENMPDSKYHDQIVNEYTSSREEGFKFNTGEVITSLEELGYCLKFITPQQFTKHVGDNYNHFADWVQGVFHLDHLSKTLRSTQDKKEQSKLILTFIHQGGR